VPCSAAIDCRVLWILLLLPASANADLLPPNADLAVPAALADAGAEPAELELVRRWIQRDDRWRPAAATAAEAGVLEIDGVAAGLMDALAVRSTRPAPPALGALLDAQLEPGTDACADTKHQYATGLGLVDRMLRDAEDRGERWTKREARDLRDSMDPALDAAAGALLDAAALAECRVEASLRRIDDAERDVLVTVLRRWMDPDGWPTDAERATDADALGNAWERIDRGGLLLAGAEWAEAIATGAATLAALPPTAWPTAPAILPTALGEVWLGTASNNSGTGDPILLLDPGGDDQWRIGTSRADDWTPAGIPAVRGWIDLGGADVWQSGHVGAGGALFSVSAGVDRGGDDTHRGGDLGQGGAAFGVASWWDGGGADRMTGGRGSQGFAAFGAGVLRLDGAERDGVDAAGFAQGTGGPAGVGVLVGNPGDTAYTLASPASRTWRGWGANPGQGVSWGLFDGLGGGLGVLADPAGDDAYAGGHGVQGAAQLGGLGLLVDLRGEDRYAAADLGQGACARAGVGALLDADGTSGLMARELAQGAAAGGCLGVLGVRDGAATSADTGRAWGSGTGLALRGTEAAVGLPAQLASQTPSRLAGILVDPALADGDEPGGPSLIGAWSAARGGGPELEAALQSLDPRRPADVAAARGRVDAAARTPGARQAAAHALVAAAARPPIAALALAWLAELAADGDVASIAALHPLPAQHLASDSAPVRAAALKLAAAIAAAADTDADADARLPGLATEAAARMQRDDDPRVRAAAAQLLGWIGGPGAASVLVDALDGPTRLLRDAAEAAVEQVIRRTDGVAVARALFPLASERRRARPAALRLLAATRHRDVWEVLAEALVDPDAATRRAAAEGALILRDGADRKALAAIDEALTPLRDDGRDPELARLLTQILGPPE